MVRGDFARKEEQLCGCVRVGGGGGDAMVVVVFVGGGGGGGGVGLGWE